MTTSIQTIYDQYIEVFPQETEGLAAFQNQLATKGEANITDRKTFDNGHITAASIIVSLPSKKVLLIDHAILRKQIQPGGHVEASDTSILTAAYRKCQKEVGITPEQLHYLPLSDQNPELPFAILVHDIPANSARNEPRHNHYDFWYLFTVPDGTEARQGDDESAFNPQWISFALFAENTEFSRQAEKINKLLATS